MPKFRLINYINTYRDMKVYFLSEEVYNDFTGEKEIPAEEKEKFVIIEMDLCSIMSAWEMYTLEILKVDESNMENGVILIVVADIEDAKDRFDALTINKSFDPEATAEKLRKEEECRKNKRNYS